MASLMETATEKVRIAFDATTIAVKENTLKCGNFILPEGIESACGLMSKIFIYLDVKSLLKVISTMQQVITQPIPTLYNYYSTRCH